MHGVIVSLDAEPYRVLFSEGNEKKRRFVKIGPIPHFDPVFGPLFDLLIYYKLATFKFGGYIIAKAYSKVNVIIRPLIKKI